MELLKELVKFELLKERFTRHLFENIDEAITPQGLDAMLQKYSQKSGNPNAYNDLLKHAASVLGKQSSASEDDLDMALRTRVAQKYGGLKKPSANPQAASPVAPAQSAASAWQKGGLPPPAQPEKPKNVWQKAKDAAQNLFKSRQASAPVGATSAPASAPSSPPGARFKTIPSKSFGGGSSLGRDPLDLDKEKPLPSLGSLARAASEPEPVAPAKPAGIEKPKIAGMPDLPDITPQPEEPVPAEDPFANWKVPGVDPTDQVPFPGSSPEDELPPSSKPSKKIPKVRSAGSKNPKGWEKTPPVDSWAADSPSIPMATSDAAPPKKQKKAGGVPPPEAKVDPKIEPAAPMASKEPAAQQAVKQRVKRQSGASEKQPKASSGPALPDELKQYAKSMGIDLNDPETLQAIMGPKPISRF